MSIYKNSFIVIIFVDVNTVPGIDCNSLNILFCWDLLLVLNNNY